MANVRSSPKSPRKSVLLPCIKQKRSFKVDRTRMHEVSDCRIIVDGREREKKSRKFLMDRRESRDSRSWRGIRTRGKTRRIYSGRRRGNWRPGRKVEIRVCESGYKSVIIGCIVGRPPESKLFPDSAVLSLPPAISPGRFASCPSEALSYIRTYIYRFIMPIRYAGRTFKRVY